MPELKRIASKQELPPPGEAKEFTLGEKTICVANVNGQLSAMDNVCGHRGGPLGQGMVDGGKVVCPWHGWRWDPLTGAAMERPEVAIPVYPLEIEGDDVLVKL
ncbi:MAG: Rieske 2Fe-2S domain-containing protein [Terriglobales bacterium]|jgi:nitrite reductase (NADH) small subunit